MKEVTKEIIQALTLTIGILGVVGILAFTVISCDESKNKRKNDLVIIKYQNNRVADSINKKYEADMINKGFVKKYPPDLKRAYWESKNP